MSVTASRDLHHSFLPVLVLSTSRVLFEYQRARGQRKEKSNESKRSDDENPILLSTGDKPRFSNGADVECELRVPSCRSTRWKGDRRDHGPSHLYRTGNAKPAFQRCQRR